MRKPFSILTLFALAAAASAQTYRLTDLGTLGGRSSLGRAVNDRGQAAGGSVTVSGATHAFLYSATGGMRDLNGLLDASGAGRTLTEAYGLSDTGFMTTAP